MSRRELLDRDLDRAAIVRARGSGRLFDVHPDFGVYSIMPPELLTEEGRLVAALRALDGDAVLGVGTAAWRWKLIPTPPFAIALVTRHEHTAPAGVVLHRSPALRTDDVTTDDDGFPITTVTRTLLDLAIDYRLGALLRPLAEAEFHHDVRPRDVLAVLRRGHRGSARLRRALDIHVPGYGKAKSQNEKRFRRLLIQHGIELPERNQKVGSWTVDCLWPDLKVVVEIDGGQHERDRQANVDAARDLWLRANGYIVRRYSWQQLTQQPDAVIADLLAAFAEAQLRSQP